MQGDQIILFPFSEEEIPYDEITGVRLTADELDLRLTNRTILTDEPNTFQGLLVSEFIAHVTRDDGELTVTPIMPPNNFGIDIDTDKADFAQTTVEFPADLSNIEFEVQAKNGSQEMGRIMFETLGSGLGVDGECPFCGRNNPALAQPQFIRLWLNDSVIQQISYDDTCLLYTSPSPRDLSTSRMPSSA